MPRAAIGAGLCSAGVLPAFFACAEIGCCVLGAHETRAMIRTC